MMTKDDIDKLIIENEGIAYDIAWNFNKKLKGIIEFDDLLGLSRLGLVKAANTFDISKNFKFSTYAYKVISNTILLQLRQENKHKNVFSYDAPITFQGNKTFAEFLVTNKNFEDEIVKADLIDKLNKFIDSLEPVSNKVLKLHLLSYSQVEIAEIVGISQPTVSRILKSVIYKLRIKFEVEGDEFYGNS